MSNFKDFRNGICSLGGVWAGKDVYFNQMRDGYSAAYRPGYPNCCNRDMVIQTIYGTGAANRGNVELIYFDKNKNGYTSAYAMHMEDFKIMGIF